jgi:hypothetical protein
VFCVGSSVIGVAPCVMGFPPSSLMLDRLREVSVLKTKTHSSATAACNPNVLFLQQP